mmetsp:Transcript_72706/g.128455  ORF Transcript_72706/g.128455 Transcript_72706/m.128455 type:complete len:204 (-) Transcript_72706:1114-1725(-)
MAPGSSSTSSAASSFLCSSCSRSAPTHASTRRLIHSQVTLMWMLRRRLLVFSIQARLCLMGSTPGKRLSPSAPLCSSCRVVGCSWTTFSRTSASLTETKMVRSIWRSSSCSSKLASLLCHQRFLQNFEARCWYASVTSTAASRRWQPCTMSRMSPLLSSRSSSRVQLQWKLHSQRRVHWAMAIHLRSGWQRFPKPIKRRSSTH